MKELNLTKESYERSTLVITEFSEEDVIVTSKTEIVQFFGRLFGENDVPVIQDKG